MAFTGNYGYEPEGHARRIFGFSFAFWSLLVGAVYTAELASLLVSDQYTSEISSLEVARSKNLKICFHGGSASQTVAETMYPKLKDYDKKVNCESPEEMYDKLDEGECDILYGTKADFEVYGSQEDYGCNLVQAGNYFSQGIGSFASKYEPWLNNEIANYAINRKIQQMRVEQNINDEWSELLQTLENRCTDEEDDGRRLLVENESNRRLSTESTTFGGDEEDEGVMDLKGMAGVFVVHFFLMAIAFAMAIFNFARRKRSKRKRSEADPATRSESLDCQINELKKELESHIEFLNDEFLEKLTKIQDNLPTDETSSTKGSSGNNLRSSIKTFLTSRNSSNTGTGSEASETNDKVEGGEGAKSDSNVESTDEDAKDGLTRGTNVVPEKETMGKKKKKKKKSVSKVTMSGIVEDQN